MTRQQEQLRSLNQELAEGGREEVRKAKEEMLRAQRDCERSILKAHSEKQQVGRTKEKKGRKVDS